MMMCLPVLTVMCVVCLLVNVTANGKNPVWEIIPSDTIAIVGQPATLYCKVNDTSSVVWMKNQDFIAMDPKNVNDCCRVSGDFANGEWNLEIINVKRSDEGNWTCLISDQRNGKTARLIVLDTGPRCSVLSDSSSTNDVIEGSILELECNVPDKATPPGLLTWTENGEITSKNGNSPLMYTKKVKRTDNGSLLNCKLTHTSISSPLTCHEDIKLNVQYPPKAMNLPEVCVKKGTKLQINCSYTPGRPQHTEVKWKKADEMDAKRSNPLIIDNVQPGRNNVKLLFTCVVSNLYYNGVRGEDSITTSVTVQYDPVVTVPIVTYVREGESLHVTCAVDSEPVTNNVEWIYPDGTATRSRTLAIISIHRSQWGTYTCRAVNQFCDEIGGTGQGSNTTLVDIYFPAKKVDIYASHVGPVESGNEVSFTCTTSSSNPAATLSWYINGSYVHDGDESVSFGDVHESIGDFNGKLSEQMLSIITRPEHNMASFKCAARNTEFDVKHGVESSQIPLTVYFSKYPRDCKAVLQIERSYPPNEDYFEANTTLVVRCTSCSSNPPADLDWYVDSENMTSLLPLKTHRDGLCHGKISEQDFALRLTWRHHGSTLRCDVTRPNDADSVIDVVTLRLNVRYAPIVLHRERNNQSRANQGESAELVCQMTGNPIPNITWYGPFGETPIISGLNYSINDTVVTSILTFNNVTRDILGKYICWARNDMGKVNFTITLGEKTKPDEATDVKVTARSNTLIVTWKPGFDGGEKQYFYVEYLDLSSGEQGVTKTTENEMIIINELKPLTLYAVTVVSENVFGESRSLTVQQTTLDHLSASPPSKDVTDDESGLSSKGIWIVGILAVLLMLPLATALLVVGYCKRKRKRVNSRRNIQRSNAAGGSEIDYTRISFSLPKEGRATQASHSEEQEAVVNIPIYAIPQKDKKKRKQKDSKATKNALYENVIPADSSAEIHGTKDNEIADAESVHYTNIERSSQVTSEGIEVEGLSRGHESCKDASLTYVNLPHEDSRETARQEGVYELLQEPIPPRDADSLRNDERQRSNDEADVCQRVPYENMPLIGSPGAKDVNTVSDDWCESVNGATSDRERCCEELTYANQHEIESESNYELLE